jgi:beta-glucosidase
LLIYLFVLGVASAQTPLYQDANQPVEARVKDLLAQMTLEEKVGQMTQVNITRLMGDSEWVRGPLDEAWLRRILVDAHVGSLLSGGGMAPVPNTPGSWAEMTNALQRYAVDNSRLGIPIIYGIDAVHGHNNVVGATIYPHNLGLAATRNPDLVQQIAVKTAQDMLATGIHWNFAPSADIGRDIRWGRFYETFGEDPLLASEMVAAGVRGLQENGQVAATVKHFTGYGEADTGIDRSPALIDLRSLRQLHLPAFKAGLGAGAKAVMPNSGSVNGVPVHTSAYLLTDVLRGELGFEGVVISDWNDINKLVDVHKVAATFKDAVAMSINAGVDMYMVPHDAQGFTTTLLELVGEGRVSQERIDEAVRRILTLKFELGLFEDPYVDVEQASSIIEEERTLAKQAALESITLLKNHDNVLPFSPEVQNILVVGPSADSLKHQMGGWTIGWQGIESNAEMPPGVTVVEGLESLAPEGTTINYLDNYRDGEAVMEAATNADVIVVIVGEEPYAEGEGRGITTNLAFAEDQLELLRTVSEIEKPMVVVLMSGRPLMIPSDIERAMDAFIMAYLPGSEGGSAVADVLFGNYNPSGKLPFTWPKEIGQIPLTYDALPHAKLDSSQPLYPFGSGLSYTTFRASNMQAELNEDTITVSIDVENAGERAGERVVEVYLSRPPLPVLTPVKQLVAFDKVALESSETQTVRLEFPVSHLAVIPGDILGDANAVVLPGVYRLIVDGQQTTLEITRELMAE